MTNVISLDNLKKIHIHFHETTVCKLNRLMTLSKCSRMQTSNLWSAFCLKCFYHIKGRNKNVLKVNVLHVYAELCMYLRICRFVVFGGSLFSQAGTITISIRYHEISWKPVFYSFQKFSRIFILANWTVKSFLRSFS